MVSSNKLGVPHNRLPWYKCHSVTLLDEYVMYMQIKGLEHVKTELTAT